MGIVEREDECSGSGGTLFLVEGDGVEVDGVLRSGKRSAWAFSS